MSEPQKVFDAARQYDMVIFSGGEKRCTVRFPSDAEWIARTSKKRTVQNSLGRNKSRVREVNAKSADAEMFAKIRLDKDGPEFSDAEAGDIIGRLGRAEILDVSREGDAFRIELRVPGAVTEHLLKMPLREDLDAYQDASVRMEFGRGFTEFRGSLDPSAKLYDKVHADHSGYAGAVPIIHKDAAVFELKARLEALENEADDPEA